MLPVHPGETVLLHTDGLVEVGGRELEERRAQLLAVARPAEAGPSTVE